MYMHNPLALSVEKSDETNNSTETLVNPNQSSGCILMRGKPTLIKLDRVLCTNDCDDLSLKNLLRSQASVRGSWENEDFALSGFGRDYQVSLK